MEFLTSEESDKYLRLKHVDYKFKEIDYRKMHFLYIAGLQHHKSIKDKTEKFATDINKLLNEIIIQGKINNEIREDLDEKEILLGGEWVIDGNIVSEQGHIFDYNFVTDRTDDVKAFIFVEVIVDNVYDATFTNFKLLICPLAHKDIVRLDKTTTPTKAEMQKDGFSGNRIDKTINGNTTMGIGNVEPCYRDYLQMFLPNYRYYGKAIAYTVKNYNDNRNSCND